jgi:hypothetical protein
MRTMRKSKEYFSHNWRKLKQSTFLYIKPKAEIPIYFAAQGKKAGACAGTYGDHLVTINSPEICRDVVFPALEKATKEV